jgi:hypothetical protein
LSRKKRTEDQRIKDAQALELRRAGASYAQIAKQLGYANESGPYKAVQRSLAEFMAVRDEVAPQLIELENQRLDALQTALWTQAIKGQWLATDRILKIMERRAALNGYDAPKRQEISGPNGQAIQVEQELSVNVSIEERQRRILAIVDAARGRPDPFALPGRSDMASPGGTADSSLADAG